MPNDHRVRILWWPAVRERREEFIYCLMSTLNATKCGIKSNGNNSECDTEIHLGNAPIQAESRLPAPVSPTKHTTCDDNEYETNLRLLLRHVQMSPVAETNVREGRE